MPCAESRALTNRYTLLRIAKTFSFTLGIVVLGKTLQRNLNQRYVLHTMRKSRIPHSLQTRHKNDRDEHQRIIDSASVKIAAFPALLPTLYDILRRLSQEKPVIPELLASSSLLLLPASWRKQLVLYASSSALLQSVRSSRWSKHTPPLWTLYIVGNAWLLWTFAFNSDAFPKAYTRVIISVSQLNYMLALTFSHLLRFASIRRVMCHQERRINKLATS